MRLEVGRVKRVAVSLAVACLGLAAAWLGVACMGLLLPPLSAHEPKLRDTLKGHTHLVYSVAFSPDGKTLASGSGGMGATGEIKLWDLATAREMATFQGHTAYVTSVAFSPESKTLASGSDDRTIKLWDVATGK
jgi:WD40 repeat protein